MIKIADGGPKDLLPPAIKDDPDMQAYSYAIERAVARALELSLRTRMYAAIDEQPEKILDYMAVESRAQYYEETMGIETKREIIKNSLAWYMKAGTKEAVDELIQTVFGEGRSVPWYDFEEGPGTPGMFDVITNATMEPMIYERFARIIEKAKNKSSVLRYIVVEHTQDTNLSTCTGMTVTEEMMVSNDIRIDDPDRALFLNEYVLTVDSQQAIDKTVIGMIDIEREGKTEANVICILILETDAIIYESMGSMEEKIEMRHTGHLLQATEQTIGRDGA